MATAPSRHPRFPDSTNGQVTAHGPKPAPRPTDAAAWSLAYSTDGQSIHEGAIVQDPFTYYQAFLDSDTPSRHRAGSWSPHSDSNAEAYAPCVGAQSTQRKGEQHQGRIRAAPHTLAFRLANRSSGAPLATIVEQGSLSTLDSHGSLVGVGRLPSIRTVENVSPESASPRASRSLDKRGLSGIQEEKREEYDAPLAYSAAGGCLRQLLGQPDPGCETAVLTQFTIREHEQHRSPRRHDLDKILDADDTKRLFRGIMQSVRLRSRSRPRSSSATATPQSYHFEEPSNACNNSPQPKYEGEGLEYSLENPLCIPAGAEDSYFHSSQLGHAAPGIPAIHREGLSKNFNPSASVLPPILYLPPLPGIDPKSAPVSVSHFLQLPDVSKARTGKEPPSCTRSVLPGTRDATQGHVDAGATTLSCRDKEDASAGRLLDGFSGCRDDVTSPYEYDRLGDRSRNASSCSTVSTSYSGVVLGVDLDLHDQSQCPARRSVTPVWFTPKADADVVTLRETSQSRWIQHKPNESPRRSITSSALSSLLPIAAAEGIVKPNFTTPRLSFFSPSGNLIQAADTSPSSSDTTDSHTISGSPSKPTATSRFGENATTTSAHDSLLAIAQLRPARPAPVPMTTPPISSAPLPMHLRHHHNYQRAEKSQIYPRPNSESSNLPQTMFTDGPTVKGCGGVIRSNSLTPRNSIRGSRNERSTSCFRFNSYGSGSRSGMLPPGRSSRKGKTLKKAPPHSSNRQQTQYKPKSAIGIGPVAGHALRICFCQPYDGVGKRSAEFGCGSVGDQCHNSANSRELRDTGTPNARIVDGGKEGVGNGNNVKGKRRVRKDSLVSAGPGVDVGG